MAYITFSIKFFTCNRDMQSQLFIPMLGSQRTWKRREQSSCSHQKRFALADQQAILVHGF